MCVGYCDNIVFLILLLGHLSFYYDYILQQETFEYDHHIVSFEITNKTEDLQIL